MKKAIFFLIVNLFGSNDFGQVINTIAGSTAGYGGDGGPATSAKLSNPQKVTISTAGDVYIADDSNNRIRKVNSSGIISTIVGSGVQGFSGDGGLATAAKLYNPYDIAIDATGNIYIADCNNYRVRKVNTSGIITTVAGNGVYGYSGDGGLATSASITRPNGIAVDVTGNIYFGDSNNFRVRKVNTSGVITTIAGVGTSGYSGDGGPATAAQVKAITGISIDGIGNIYLADIFNNRVRKIDTSGIITTYAGSGASGFGGDGGAAILANIDHPQGLALDAVGNLYIADATNSRIRMVNTSGIITTIAGNGSFGASGDGGPPLAASLTNPSGVAVDLVGNIYIADIYSYKIREIFMPTGVSENQLKGIGTKLFPNPNSGSFSLKFENEINNGEIILFNSIGQQVHKQKIYQGENRIVTHLSKGSYQYSIFQNKEYISGGKIIIE